jgi:hypothetical protein
MTRNDTFKAFENLCNNLGTHRDWTANQKLDATSMHETKCTLYLESGIGKGTPATDVDGRPLPWKDAPSPNCVRVTLTDSWYTEVRIDVIEMDDRESGHRIKEFVEIVDPDVGPKQRGLVTLIKLLLVDGISSARWKRLMGDEQEHGYPTYSTNM